jgi:hypothetical protein
MRLLNNPKDYNNQRQSNQAPGQQKSISPMAIDITADKIRKHNDKMEKKTIKPNQTTKRK